MNPSIINALTSLYKQAPAFDLDKGCDQGPVAITKDGIQLLSRSLDKFEPVGRLSATFEEYPGNKTKIHLPVSIPNRMRTEILNKSSSIHRRGDLHPLALHDVAIKGVQMEFVKGSSEIDMILTFKEGTEEPFRLEAGYHIKTKIVRTTNDYQKQGSQFVFTNREQMVIRCYSGGGSRPHWILQVPQSGPFTANNRKFRSIEEWVETTIGNNYYTDVYRTMGSERLEGRLKAYSIAMEEASYFRNESFTLQDGLDYSRIGIEQYEKFVGIKEEKTFFV